MHLERISVDGVRNLVDVAVAPHRRLTVLVGENGQGKTNLLEAIHLCAALRPLRKLERPSDLVAFGRERGVARASFDLDGPLPIEVVCEPKGRRVTVAGKSVRDVSELAARIGVVSFLPEDTAMVRGGPEGRRKALDRFAFGLMPGFVEIARRFEEALEKRNRVLKSPRVDEDLLDSYSTPYAHAAAALLRARVSACAAWAPAVKKEAAAIGPLDVELSYHSSLPTDLGGASESGDPLATRIEEELAASRSSELARRTTAIGPHHDDLLLEKDDKKARFLASQGEARALVLAMKLAAVRLYTGARGTAPLLILDDVAGELDPARAQHLFRAVDETGAQTFVSTTHAGALPALGAHALLHVNGGRVRWDQG